jgi:indolepyruvate ferredoxin oxidoreductase
MTVIDLQPPTDTIRLEDRFEQERGRVGISGVQALARLVVDQHRADAARGWRTAGLVSGYRGSPLGGLDQILEQQQALLKAHDIRFLPGVNEELAATAVYGSQLAQQLPDPRFEGVFGLWYGKAPGVDRCADAFKHGSWMGTPPRGGVLVVAGDDPSSKSSTLPSSSEAALAESYMPVLYPGSVADVLRMGRFGFEMSRFSGAWAGFKIVTNVADAYELVDLAPVTDIVIPDFEWRGKPWKPTVKPAVNLDAARLLEHEVLEGRLAAATAFAAANRLDRIGGATGDARLRDGRLGLVAAGRTYLELRTALDRLGLDEAALAARGVRLLQLAMVHPVDRDVVREFARGLDDVLVVEEKRSFIESQVRDALYDLPDRPRVLGKHGADGAPLVPVDGELDADRLIVTLARPLAALVGEEHVDLRHPVLQPRRTRLSLTPLQRTPFFCSGCPHNRSTVVPEGSLAGGGIGCHTLTTFMDRSLGVTQMGGEGVTWAGAAPFTKTEHLFQNLGDGTFFHSGSLAVRQAIASGANVTYKLLYNSATAMTGGQHADGSVDPASVTRMLAAEGVARTVVVTDDPKKYPRRTRWAKGVKVRHRDEMDAVQRELREVPGVTVLLYDQACAAEARRKRKRGKLPDPPQRVLINEAVCEGCGDCGRKSNCLSVEPVETEFGRKTQIDQTSCNKDYSCLLGDCPSFVTVVPGTKKKARTALPDLPADLPEPAQRPEAVNLVMVGIGGTGVVTTNQVLATAALVDGLHARAVDQTGLSQKAGAVVSHLRVTSTAEDRPGFVGTGEADAYLALDVLAGAAEGNLKRCNAERTTAVVSTSEVPTGTMVTDPTVAFPEGGSLLQQIAARTARVVSVDVLALAEEVFGNTAPANLVVVGAAYQAGLLPMSAAGIERAIELNGVAVAANVQAFRAGRQLVLDPSWPASEPAATTSVVPARAVRDTRTAQAALDLVVESGVGGEVRRALEIRVPDLAAYQSLRYARTYLDVVLRVARAESAVAGEQRLAEAVARNLYKLMAYKDEYEVARLHLDPDLERKVKEDFGSDAQIRYLLHPPVLRALGIEKKIAFGRSARPLFRVLRALRRLRGTKLDPFGFAEVRRVERRLLAEYLGTVDRLVAELSAETHERALTIAALPDMVRGYEEIKLASVEEYRVRLRELLAELAVPRRGDLAIASS